MLPENDLRVGIVYPGDREARRNATQSNNRFKNLFDAFTAERIHAEPCVYHDDFCDEAGEQLRRLDAALVWVNPIEGGRDRSRLDKLLLDVAASGVFVSAHPSIIMMLGTKQVLYDTREMDWGSDVHVYRSMAEMARELPKRLLSGRARVLKQYRGHSGIGVWKAQLPPQPEGAPTADVDLDSLIQVRHAQRGSIENVIRLGDFLAICEAYFAGDGRVIDQDYQERIMDRMIRCYLVHDQVAGFGHQAVNALYPAPDGGSPEDAPAPGPRLYYPPGQPDFQEIKQKMEAIWLPELRQVMGLEVEQLPILWDCDFMFGPKNGAGKDTYVLCEINVSSVAPYPESAVPYIVKATKERALEARALKAL